MTHSNATITWEKLTLKLRNPFRVSYGASETRDAFWVRLAGDAGWGEGTIPPYYGIAEEEMTACWAAAAARRDQLPEEPDQIAAWVGAQGPAPARCALDLALHDRMARRRGLPLYQLLNLPRPEQLETSYTLSIGTPAKVAEQAVAAARYPILKLKLGGDADLETVAAVRQARPDARLLADVNGGWTVDQAIAMGKALRRFRLELIEQPVAAHDLEGLGAVQTQIDLPVVADESLQTPADLARLAALGVRGVNLKLMKIGGIAPALAMLTQARQLGMQIMLGSMIETSLGVTAVAHLAGLADWLDLDAPLLLANDPFEGALYDGPRIALPDRPGIGVRRR
jgi:L-alanine-DL-glutamate epimerase-like enolase superfamily enzyme